MSNPYPSINVGAIPANDGAARGALAIGAGLSDLGRAAGGIANNLQQTKDAMAREQARREGAARKSAFFRELSEKELSYNAELDAASQMPVAARAEALKRLDKVYHPEFRENLPRKYATNQDEINEYTTEAIRSTQAGMLKWNKMQLSLPSDMATEDLNSTISGFQNASPSIFVEKVMRASGAARGTAIGGPDSPVGKAIENDTYNTIRGHAADYRKSMVSSAKMRGDAVSLSATKDQLILEREQLVGMYNRGYITSLDSINEITEGINELEIARRALETTPKSLPVARIADILSPNVTIPVDDAFGQKVAQDTYSGRTITVPEAQATLAAHGKDSSIESARAYIDDIGSGRRATKQAFDKSNPDAVTSYMEKFTQSGLDVVAVLQGIGAENANPTTLIKNADTPKTAATLDLAFRMQQQHALETSDKVKGKAIAESLGRAYTQAKAQNKNPEIAYDAIVSLVGDAGYGYVGFTKNMLRSEEFNTIREAVKSAGMKSGATHTFARAYDNDLGYDILTVAIMSDTVKRKQFIETGDKGGDDVYNQRANVLRTMLTGAGGIKPNVSRVATYTTKLFEANTTGILDKPDDFEASLPGSWFFTNLSDKQGGSALFFNTDANNIAAFSVTLGKSSGHFLSRLADDGHLDSLISDIIGTWGNDEQFYENARAYTGAPISDLKTGDMATVKAFIFNAAVSKKDIQFLAVDGAPDVRAISRPFSGGGETYLAPGNKALNITTDELWQYNNMSALAADFARRAKTVFGTQGWLMQGREQSIGVAASHPQALAKATKEFTEAADEIVNMPQSRGFDVVLGSPSGATAHAGRISWDTSATQSAKIKAWKDEASNRVSGFARVKEADNGATIFEPYPNWPVTNEQQALLNKLNNEAARINASRLARSGKPEDMEISNKLTQAAAVESGAAPKKKPARSAEPVKEQVETYSTVTGRHPQTVLSEGLSRPTETLDIAMYSANDQTLIDAVLKRAREGTAVRVVLDPGQDKTQQLGSVLRAAGVSVRYGEPTTRTGKDTSMHLKFAITDTDIYTGSYNWTRGAIDNKEQLVHLRGDKHMKVQRELFDKLWGEASAKHKLNKRDSVKGKK